MSNQTYTDDDLRRVAGIKDEQFNHALQTILESVSGMQQAIKNLPTRDEFNELKSDVKTIKAVLKATNHDLQDVQRDVKTLKKRTDRLEDLTDTVIDHGIRLTRLEQAH